MQDRMIAMLTGLDGLPADGAPLAPGASIAKGVVAREIRLTLGPRAEPEGEPDSLAESPRVVLPEANERRSARAIGHNPGGRGSTPAPAAPPNRNSELLNGSRPAVDLRLIRDVMESAPPEVPDRAASDDARPGDRASPGTA